jgi:Beta propeller domain
LPKSLTRLRSLLHHSIKADENFVYAAYGNYILIWDLAGNQVAQVTMPPIDLPDNWGQPYEQEQQGGTVGKQEGGSSTMYVPDYVWYPKPSINAMLLTDNHLIAVVTGYGENYYWGPYDQTAVPSHILSGYQASQIRVYEKTPSGNLTFVGKKDVNGNYVDARSIGNVVHVATAATVDVYTHLWNPLDKYNFGENITNEEYQIQALTLAEEKLIPNMARKLVEELQVSDGVLPDMMQINQWMTQYIDDDDLNNNETQIIPFDQYDVISNVASVTSFDVTADLNEQGELDVSSSTYFAPNYFSTLYGNTDHLVLATSGWDWDAVNHEQTQSTYLVALQINDDASTSFVSVGKVQGHLLNQYALDIVGDELRAATTVEHQTWWWWWGGPRPMPMMMEGDMMMQEDVAVVAESTATTAESAQAADAMPIWTQPPESDESRTEIYMTVLRLTGGSNPGQMEKKGDVQIGEKNERITSVRFFDNVAYAVTFERTDPFYVLDMSVPKVVGELKLPGFSSYLHSMNADNTLLLAVGQNATDDGMVTGLMITVFDATDPANPQALVSHTFENSPNAYSSSNVEWDYKSFRYVDGKLIVPVDIWYNQLWNEATQALDPLPEGVENFQGFAVMDVSTSAISESFRVSHTTAPGSCSFCNVGYLPTRSFVYSGDLMTVRNDLVISTDLATGQEVWRLPVTLAGEKADCCFV